MHRVASDTIKNKIICFQTRTRKYGRTCRIVRIRRTISTVLLYFRRIGRIALRLSWLSYLRRKLYGMFRCSDGTTRLFQAEYQTDRPYLRDGGQWEHLPRVAKY